MGGDFLNKKVNRDPTFFFLQARAQSEIFSWQGRGPGEKKNLSDELEGLT